MKTAWNYDNLWRKFKGGNEVHKWVYCKKREFELKTDVPWSTQMAHGYRTFHPVLHAPTIEHLVESVTVEQIEIVKAAWKETRSRGFGYAGFLALSKESGFTLKTLLPIVLAAVRLQMASLGVDRAGKANQVRFK